MVEYDYQKKALPNGLRLVWQELPHLHSAFIVAFVKGGPVYETRANNGISHLLEHLHCSFTEKHPNRESLAAAIDALGGEFEGATTPDLIEFSLDVLPSQLGSAARLLADMLKPQQFPSDILESEKNLILNEQAGHEQIFGHPLTTILFPGHPYGYPIGGHKASVRKLSLDQVLHTDQLFFRASNITVALSGRFSDGQMRQVSEAFDSLPQSAGGTPSEASPPTQKFPLLRRKGAAAGVRPTSVGFWIEHERVDDVTMLALSFISHGLSSPSSLLQQQLRYVRSSIYYHQLSYDMLCGNLLFSADALVHWRQQRDFIRQTLAEFDRLRQNLADLAWFERTRNHFLSWFEKCKDSPKTIAHRIGRAEAHPYRDPVPLNEDIRATEAMRESDIVAAAQRCFTRDRLFLAYASYFNHDAKMKRLLKMFG